MRYTHCFFDMDGTVCNSAPGITHSVQHALRRLGITPPPEEELLCFVGPPLTDSFQKYYGLDPAGAEQAVVYYREYYRERGIFENEVYEGIPALLDSLRRAGVVCAMATCKPHIFANRILAHFDLADRFVLVSGAEMDGVRGQKHEVITYAMEQLGLDSPLGILMIGDRRDDVLGAAHCGMDSAGVLWGFGGRDELTAAGATHLCASVEALERLILGKG